VTVYTNFTLDADSTTVYIGDTVTFTPRFDGVAGSAAAWKWIPDDTAGDHVSCDNGISPCKKAIHGAGTMWAYTVTSAGDSASKHIAVLARRHLSLTPSDTVLVDTGSTVQFTASGQGATLHNIIWSSDDATIARAPRSPSGRIGRHSASGITSSTCANGVETCQDIVHAAYVRSVSAIVDDSSQVASVTVIVREQTTIDPAPDSCYDIPGSCWADPPADAEVGPTYVAPATYTKARFVLDYTDNQGNLHIFTLTNARFQLVRVTNSTSRYVDAIYNIVGWDEQTPSVAGETLIWCRLVPIRSTLVDLGNGTYSGGFIQNGRAGGSFWRRL
jgi:plastocyanin